MLKTSTCWIVEYVEMLNRWNVENINWNAGFYIINLNISKYEFRNISTFKPIWTFNIFNTSTLKKANQIHSLPGSYACNTEAVTLQATSHRWVCPTSGRSYKVCQSQNYLEKAVFQWPSPLSHNRRPTCQQAYSNCADPKWFLEACTTMSRDCQCSGV